jgi:transcriptional regulator with XRE-family HTH domain
MLNIFSSLGGKVMQELAKLRKKRGLSQTGLGEALCLDGNSISRYERGVVKPSIEIANKIANFFDIAVDELLNGPTVEEFRVTLKYVKTLEGVDEEMNMNGIALTIAEDGFVGVSGGKKFENYEDIEKVVEVVRKRLTFGFEHRDEMKE